MASVQFRLTAPGKIRDQQIESVQMFFKLPGFEQQRQPA
jgi:hypothetical protein